MSDYIVIKILENEKKVWNICVDPKTALDGVRLKKNLKNKTVVLLFWRRNKVWNLRLYLKKNIKKKQKTNIYSF